MRGLISIEYLKCVLASAADSRLILHAIESLGKEKEDIHILGGIREIALLQPWKF
jgi:hypothetical protein